MKCGRRERVCVRMRECIFAPTTMHGFTSDPLLYCYHYTTDSISSLLLTSSFMFVSVIHFQIPSSLTQIPSLLMMFTSAAAEEKRRARVLRASGGYRRAQRRLAIWIDKACARWQLRVIALRPCINTENTHRMRDTIYAMVPTLPDTSRLWASRASPKSATVEHKRVPCWVRVSMCTRPKG